MYMIVDLLYFFFIANNYLLCSLCKYVNISIDVHLLLHTVIHEPSQKPNIKTINKSTSKTGSLSQIAGKINIVKCKTKLPKTNRLLVLVRAVFH